MANLIRILQHKQITQQSIELMKHNSHSCINPKTKKAPSESQSEYSQILSQPVMDKCLLEILADPLQDLSQEFYANDPIKNLRILKETIGKKMQQLDGLNVQYYQKQEKMFLKTFINMMDRMSNQLLEAKMLYANIDQEIDAEKQCVQLRQRLKFFKDESIYLNNELSNTEEILLGLRLKNSQKEASNFQLRTSLIKQAKKQQKYKQRRYSLETKIDCEMIKPKSSNTRKHSQDRSKSVSSYSQNIVGGIYNKNNQTLQIQNLPRPKTSMQKYREAYKVQTITQLLPTNLNAMKVKQNQKKQTVKQTAANTTRQQKSQLQTDRNLTQAPNNSKIISDYDLDIKLDNINNDQRIAHHRYFNMNNRARNH